MKRNNQQGFTLIELIMVIVILGILAATALPKFVNMGTDARAAALQGANGAINSAMNIAYSEALIKNLAATANTASPAPTVTMNGTSVTLNYGYPDTAGIKNAVTITTGTTSGTYTWGTATSSTGTITLTANGGSGTCTITYTAAANATTPASTAIDTSGC